ncbi:hypothetical protein ELS19_08035 [Halogeometricum borinquense]|uniref:Uncharacterized protein n=1 Tax=Halogeometricum borinquense TaxID=60847 RepID=A0A482T7X5_9EURY|nr:hypothetical protein [Halogeometricum borinquense]RYJ13924.1 hypothetical protein ELS19_08035 [Halogeometricum borinquense]
MSGERSDGYRRGRQVERDATSEPVNSVYRRLLLLIWGLGAAIVLVVPAFGVGWPGIFTVIGVMHIFFSGLIWADIRALRRQGVEWGLSRHLWFSAALVFPLVTLAYYWYVGRVVTRENERRSDDADSSTAGE